MLDQKTTPKGVIIWLICALFFTYEFLLRTVLGTFQPPIMYDLNLTPFKFAILSSTAYIAIYGVMQIPVGIIADRFGLKKALSVATIICASSVFLFAITYEFKMAVAARMLMGLGSSFGFVCMLIAVYDWLPKKHFGFCIGLSQFIGTLGPMLAAGPLHTLAESGNMHWRSLFFGLGFLGIFLLVLVVMIVKNNHESLGKFRIITKPNLIKKNLYSIFRQKQTWLIAIYSALVYFTLEYLSENEGKAFLELNGYSPRFASYMITVGWLGYAIGCPLLGFLSDFLKKRKVVMIMAAICSLVATICIVYLPISKPLLIVAFFALGIGAGGQSVGFTIMAEQCNKWYLAAGLGFNNAMISIVSAINAPFIGWLLELREHETLLSADDYVFAFSFLIVLIAGSLLTSIFFIKETYGRSTKEFTIIR